MTTRNKPLIWQFTASELGVSNWCPCGSGRRSKCFIEWKRKHTQAATPRAIVVCDVCNKAEARFCTRAYKALRRTLREQLTSIGEAITENAVLDELEQCIENGSYMAHKMRSE